MEVFQYGIDVSRYQGSINWTNVAASGKQFVIARLGSTSSGGIYVDPYFLQNVNGAHAAGLRVGAYYYTYATTEAAVNRELTTFLNALQGVRLEYPVFVDVEASQLTGVSRTQLTGLVKYAMDVLYQRGWYAGWYSYTNFINNYLNAGALSDYPLWVADYRATLGYRGAYTMWQYSSTGQVNGVGGSVDLNYSYRDFLPAIQAGGFNGFGSEAPQLTDVNGYVLNVFGKQTEYFNSPNFNDVVGYLPVGSYPVTQITTQKYQGYDWVIFQYQGGQYWTALIDDRNRLIAGEVGGDSTQCQIRLAEANARIEAAKAALNGIPAI